MNAKKTAGLLFTLRTTAQECERLSKELREKYEACEDALEAKGHLEKSAYLHGMSVGYARAHQLVRQLS